MANVKPSNVGGKVVSQLSTEHNLESNESVHKKLSQLVLDNCVSKISNTASASCGSLEINDFSISFGIAVNGHSEREGVYVKIPKADLFLRGEGGRKDILPLSDADRKLAEAEYHSLTHLSQYWRSEDIRVSFVEPMGFLKDHNAIVTRRVYGRDFYQIYRKCDLLRRLWKRDKIDRAGDLLHRIGVALSRFHETSNRESAFKMEGIINKIEHYFLELKLLGIDRNFINDIKLKLNGFRNLETPTYITRTLKGLDIRNVLIDGKGGLFILDPGKMKEDCREADIARFLVTCRILYWGSIAFFLQISPDYYYERHFVHGYYGGHAGQSKLLDALVIKELMKHWRMALLTLQVKPWPMFLKYALKHTYINPFYKTHIATSVTKLLGG